MNRAAALVACVAATVVFSVYSRTLLPGVDLGDTGGFQAAVLWPETSARQAYPLYYSLARPFVLAVSPDNPARGLNLFSALCGGLAVGLVAYFAALLTGSIIAGAVVGFLLGFSYTFWTQSIIAEVYTLHVALIACCLLALLGFKRQPTERRLAIVFAVYAVSFGNHLSMILLLVPFALFLVLAHPSPRDLFRARTLALAAGIAAAGALLYAPNLLFVWTNIDAPPGGMDRLAAFWFDVTKADWRDTMIAGVDSSELLERAKMLAWDARLQFGIVGIVASAIGIMRLARSSGAWSALFASAYVINAVFALTYNVGDPHVFLLPGHVFAALSIAGLFAATPAARVADERGLGVPITPSPLDLIVKIVLIPVFSAAFINPARLARPVSIAIASALFALAGYLAWDNWPSVDRHTDRRADVLVARTTAGLTDSGAVLLTDLGWQAENAILYSARYERRQLAWQRVADVLPHLPFLVDTNHAIGRDVVLAGNAAARVSAAYGPLFRLVPDGVPTSLAERAAAIPRGTPYVLTLLEPTSDEPLDADDFNKTVSTLASPWAERSDSRFQFWAGLAGERGAVHEARDEPFSRRVTLLGDRFDIRFESWLPYETFRRAGFGHVRLGRSSVLTIERGVSLVWFQSDGSPVVAYESGLYAPKPRIRIPAAIPQQVARGSSAILERANGS